MPRPWFKFSKTPAFDFGHLTEFSIFFCYAIFMSDKKVRNFVSFHATEKFLTDLEMAAQNKFFDEVVADLTRLLRRSRLVLVNNHFY